MRTRILYSICAVLLSIGAIYLCFSCYYNHKQESALFGNWCLTDSCDISSNQILTFDWNGKYYDSNTGSETWNYEFIEPDSLIMYHHALYEERYKILSISEDSLIMKLSESLFHAEDMGEKVEAPYGDGSTPIFTYTRINYNTTPE